MQLQRHVRFIHGEATLIFCTGTMFCHYLFITPKQHNIQA